MYSNNHVTTTLHQVWLHCFRGAVATSPPTSQLVLAAVGEVELALFLCSSGRATLLQTTKSGNAGPKLKPMSLISFFFIVTILLFLMM